jgi:CheY-like chemotaxis protein
VAEREEVRVLVVDDHVDEAQSLAALLGLSGYVVQVATSAAQALSLVASFEPQCLLVDIDMPGMNGVDLAAALRRGRGADLVIIAVTGWGREDQVFSSDFEHFDYCLRKPVDPRRIEQLLPALHGD